MPKVRPRSAFVAPCIPTRALNRPPAGSGCTKSSMTVTDYSSGAMARSSGYSCEKAMTGAVGIRR
jgi:hypothetical protein